MHSVMALLFRTSFCLLTVLFYSTSYCASIESVGEQNSLRAMTIGDFNISFVATGTDLEYFYRKANPELRAPIFSLGNIAQLCTSLTGARSEKFLCLLCRGFDFSCLLSTTTTTTSTTPATSTTPTTTTPAPTPAPAA